MKRTLNIFLFLIAAVFAITVFSPVWAQDKMYPFKTGTVTLDDGNIIEFSLSAKNRNLVAFNAKQWNGNRFDKSILTITLYDHGGNVIQKSSSLPVTKDFPSFGTISFKNIDPSKVADIGSFTVKVETSP